MNGHTTGPATRPQPAKHRGLIAKQALHGVLQAPAALNADAQHTITPHATRELDIPVRKTLHHTKHKWSGSSQTINMQFNEFQ